MKNVLLANGKRLLLLALGAGSLGAAGCGGQVSFFEVRASLTGTSVACAFAVYSCEVNVSGAAKDQIVLSDKTCRTPSSLQLGTFQYGTEAESGTVTFRLDLMDGNLKKLATGTASAEIKAGGRVPVELVATADPVAFEMTGACPKL